MENWAAIAGALSGRSSCWRWRKRQGVGLLDELRAVASHLTGLWEQSRNLSRGQDGFRPCSHKQSNPYPINSKIAQRRALLHFRFRWLGGMAFQFDHDRLHRGIAGIFRQVGSGGLVLGLPCLDGKVLLLSR